VAKTVLVVDDNEFIRRALCDLFQGQADFEVCADAENGREAIEMAEQLRPDLIVLDLCMLPLRGGRSSNHDRRLWTEEMHGSD
jgi:chemotaxis response regulator CheB